MYTASYTNEGHVKGDILWRTMVDSLFCLDYISSYSESRMTP